LLTIGEVGIQIIQTSNIKNIDGLPIAIADKEKSRYLAGGTLCLDLAELGGAVTSTF
jgi:hypothetical protein